MTTFDDDFYGPQSGKTGELKQRERDWRKLQTTHEAAGYREGASNARDAQLQGGFDSGFQSGARQVANASYILGVASAVLAMKNVKDSSCSDEVTGSLEQHTAGLSEALKAAEVGQNTGAEQAAKEVAKSLQSIGLDNELSLCDSAGNQSRLPEQTEQKHDV